MLCLSNCAPSLPNGVQGANCGDIETREGGISYLIASKCSVKFDPNVNPITDWESWKAFADNRDIMLSPVLRSGEKPETETTTERVKTCYPETTTSETHIINFQSVVADLQNLSDYDFWSTLKDNLTGYNIGWVGCDGLVYTNGNVPGFKMFGNVSEIIPENNDSLKFFGGSFRFKHKGIIKPVKVDNFFDAFEAAPIS
jgi:hypothetical protein